MLVVSRGAESPSDSIQRINQSISRSKNWRFELEPRQMNEQGFLGNSRIQPTRRKTAEKITFRDNCLQLPDEFENLRSSFFPARLMGEECKEFFTH